jgi:spore coat polysaccharide biosynthesis predicted glycosyltransferase SpsG
MYIVGSLEYSLDNLPSFIKRHIDFDLLENQNKHLITEFGALILKTVKSLKNNESVCYSVRLSSLTAISDKCYLATAFDSEALIQKSVIRARLQCE